MKKLIGALSIILTLLSFQPAMGFDATEQFDQMQEFVNTNTNVTGSVIVKDAMSATSSDISTVSVLRSFDLAPGRSVTTTWATCLDLTENPNDLFCGKPNVLKSEFKLQAVVIAPTCDSGASVPCLQSLQVAQGGKSFVTAKFDRYSHEGRAVAANQAESDLGLPAGVSTSLFSVDLPGWEGKSLAVKPLFKMGYGMTANSPKKFVTQAFSVEVSPVVYKNVSSASFVGFTQGSRAAYGFGEQTGWPDAYPVILQTSSYSSKLWSENGRMAKKGNVPTGTRIRLTMKMPKDLPNWYFGQVENSAVAIVPGSNFNTVTFEAEPASIQKIAFSSDLAKTASSSPGANQKPFANYTVSPGSSYSISSFLEMLPTNVNRSIATATAWRIAAGSETPLTSSAAGDQSPELTRCLVRFPNFGGMVATNAPLFDSDMPKYSKGYLEYQVSGLHFAPDGVTPNLGSYTLAVPSALARCVYGLSSLPISASVSVIGDAGETRVATTTVKESADGILTVSVKGFTFSTPKVRVKFIQNAKTANTTCVKGKVVKVLKGNSAKCPSGFKKK